ncbi:MAG: alpha-E domain-containing protein [Gammaproteobacteria bacterium]|nr:alpha-E domain-containing protein [Gammaproteobacteria bacterium]
MLARSAECLYWMGRYLERTEHLCQLLGVQIGALIDRPVSELTFGWHRIYKHLQETPPSGEKAEEFSFSEDESLADAYTLTDDLTFEPSNKYSIWSCFAQSRENARQARHCISEDMWSSLNLSYLRIRDATLSDIWQDEPELFYVDLVRDVNTFFGMASVSMYRDEGWDFLQLGKTIEHLQLRVNLLAIQSQDSIPLPPDGSRDFEWTSLLNAYRASGAYQQNYGIDVNANDALDMLVSNADLPNSLMYAITRTDERIRDLDTAPDAKSGDSALRFSGRLKSLVAHEWPDTEDRARMLVMIGNLAERLHDQIAEAWFNYRNENASRQF